MGTSAMTLDSSKAVMQSIGSYDLLEKIAEGGMGAIYRGRHRDTGLIVAIKVMPAHMARKPVLLKRFAQEFRAASRLDHPNIVRALDYNDSTSTPYLVMEFVEGESLGQKLERDGRMSESDAVRIIAQVAQGLHRAHKQGLVHRDVKPDNILITPDDVAKLADLGLVKETETDLNLTKTGRGLGTPHFMAPEQFRNAKNADIRCDIYSLGATLYQMVTGELPFGSVNGPLDAWMKKIQNDLRPPREVIPTLSERLDWAIMRAMSADPEMRPSSCREFIEDVTGHSTRRSGPPSSETTVQDCWYLVYRDDQGELHTVKGSTSAIRRSFREGLLGDAGNIRASRSKSGPFEPLRIHAEFRDMVVTAAPLPLPGAKPRTSGPVTADDPTAPMHPSLAAASAEGPALTPSPSRPSPPRIALGQDVDPDEPPSFTSELFKWALLLGVFVGTATLAYWLFS